MHYVSRYIVLQDDRSHLHCQCLHVGLHPLDSTNTTEINMNGTGYFAVQGCSTSALISHSQDAVSSAQPQPFSPTPRMQSSSAQLDILCILLP